MRYTKATPEGLEALRRRCHKSTGDRESEEVLHWNRLDAAAGYVEVTGAGRLSTIGRIIDRCGSAVLGWRAAPESITLRVRIRTESGAVVFRGIEYAFAPVDMPSDFRGIQLETVAPDEEEEDSPCEP